MSLERRTTPTNRLALLTGGTASASMSIDEHIDTLAGYPVKEFAATAGFEDPAGAAWRVGPQLPAYSPPVVSQLGCLFALVAIPAALFVGMRTGKIWLGIATLIIGAWLLGNIPWLVWSIAEALRRKRFCPYCGARLHETGARQCLRCGKDWRELDQRRPEVAQDPVIDQLLEHGETGTALAELVATDGAEQVAALIVVNLDGPYEEPAGPDPVAECLALAAERLPSLKAVFINELVQSECEISWIQNGDVSPIFPAYPGLEHFQIRGASMKLGPIQHERLRAVVIESGGLGREVVGDLARSELPNLEHLELWLGTPEYGGDVTPDDLRPLVGGEKFPRLRYLGLRNAEITDDIVELLVESPLLERVRVLDLSLGTLSDRGAERLTACPAVRNLEILDIHHHYVSEEALARLHELQIDIDDRQRVEADDIDDKTGEPYRYCAVTE